MPNCCEAISQAWPKSCEISSLITAILNGDFGRLVEEDRVEPDWVELDWVELDWVELDIEAEGKRVAESLV